MGVMHIAKFVLPPHPVRWREKREHFEKLYRAGSYVVPVVVLRKGFDDWAITGSHRTAALAKVRPDYTVEDGHYFLVMDGATVLRSAYALRDREMVRLLTLLFEGNLGEEPDGYHRLVDSVWEMADDEVREALQGQGWKR